MHAEDAPWIPLQSSGFCQSSCLLPCCSLCTASLCHNSVKYSRCPSEQFLDQNCLCEPPDGSMQVHHSRSTTKERSTSSLNLNGGIVATKEILPSSSCPDNEAHKYGELEFVSYTSSPLEQFFIEKLPEMNFETEYAAGDTDTWHPPAAYCELVNSYEKQITHWLTKVEVRCSICAAIYVSVARRGPAQNCDLLAPIFGVSKIEM